MREALDTISSHRLDIEYSEENSKFVVKILDAESGEVLRQLPPQELLDAAQRIDEVRGLLFDEKS